MGKIMVHAFMFYECEKCGKKFRMWCEKGIEDGEKPSPFVIRHTCGGFAKDISGLLRINKVAKSKFVFDLDDMELPKNESYFANRKNSDCGVAVLK